MGRRVALALGAGGARGYAHIGALQVIEECGYEVVAVAGTSMGALVGGLHAAGRLDAYTEWVTGLTQYDVWRLLDMNLGGGGAIRAERIFSKVGDILGGALIEDCAIPFTAVATDLNHRREVWFQRGPVATAIRASVAIPSLVTPIVVDGRLLVDGGLMNPVPIEPTAAVMSDLTVAVSLQAGHSQGMPVAPVRTPGPIAGSVRSLTHRVSALMGGGSHASTEAPDAASGEEVEPVTEGASPASVAAPGYAPAPKDLASTEIFNRSFDTMAALITRYRMASNPPDVLVSVPSDACRTMDFHRASEMIALGRELTATALDDAGY
ncbi:patatin-like phospholipase family protein [Phycicoccus avicenniae]|uniref:patatin-like phospholipase family protein n=1 Tax=Phycicoccus avicenniae TaxID=2828860 RepID=UPI003D26B429